MRSLAVILCLSGVFTVTSLASPNWLHAQSEPDSSSDSAPNVTKLNGVVEAVNSLEITTGNEQIPSLTIERIVPHGSTIKAGQNVVWFDSKAIAEKLKDAEIEMRLSQLTMDDEEFNHKQFLANRKLDRAAAERSWQAAQQIYNNFVKVDRDRTVMTQKNSLKSSLASLENATEELKQLQQMYDADDLTEESEEIVLKRAKRSVESAQFRHEGTKIVTERAIKQTLPRTSAEQNATFERADRAHVKAIRELTTSNTRGQIEIQKKRDAFKKAQEKLAELKEERKRVALASPIDGIVVHGKLTRGKLSEKPSLMKKDATVTGPQVIATVLAPGKLQIRVDLEQKHLAIVRPGQKCEVEISGVTGFSATGTVKSVSAIPYAANKYDCLVSFSTGKHKVTPTMTCQLVFKSAEKEAGKKEPAKKE